MSTRSFTSAARAPWPSDRGSWRLGIRPRPSRGRLVYSGHSERRLHPVTRAYLRKAIPEGNEAHAGLTSSSNARGLAPRWRRGQDITPRGGRSSCSSTEQAASGGFSDLARTWRQARPRVSARPPGPVPQTRPAARSERPPIMEGRERLAPTPELAATAAATKMSERSAQEQLLTEREALQAPS